PGNDSPPLELVVHGLAGRAVWREAALGIARALATQQDGRAARAVLGVDDLRRLQQLEQRFDGGGRGELRGECLLDAVDLRRVEQRVAEAVDPGLEAMRLAAAVRHPPELLAVACQQ